MRLLYISGFSRMVLFNKLIPGALRNLGYEVEVFDWNSVYPFNKSLKIFSRDKVKKKINSELLKKAKSFKPDFAFVLKGEPVFTETLIKLKEETGAVIFNWFGDDPWEFPLFSGKIAKYYDFFFTYDPYSVELYKNSGYNSAYHLPYGYNPVLANSIHITGKDKKKYSCDVAFIGSHYPKREELLSKIKSKFDIKIWGRGWKNTKCSDIYAGNALYGIEMLKAMKCTKVLLNIHKGFEEGLEASGEGLNLRVMEGAACGCCQITNLQADIPNRFEIDKEIAAFQTWDEANEQIEFYLKNTAERLEIGKKSYERVVKDHSLEKRFTEMFNLISEKEKSV